MVRLLAILLVCICIVTISCTGKDNEVIKYLKNTPVTLMDFGLYRVSKEFEKIEIASDNLVYELHGNAEVGADSEGKTVIRIHLDNITTSALENKNKPKNESKAKLLCIDSINHVRLQLGLYKGKPLVEHSLMNNYFSLGKKRGSEIDESTEVLIFIAYEGDNKSVACFAALLGTDIKFLEN